MSQLSPIPPTLRRVSQRARKLVKAHQRRDPAVCGDLRILPQYQGKTDQQILADATFDLSTARWVLALHAGHRSWQSYHQYLKAAEDARATSASKAVTQPSESHAQSSVSAPDALPDHFKDPVIRPLIHGSRADNWWILAGKDYVSISEGELTFHNPQGNGATLQAVVGGKSWDHYRISADIFVEPGTTPANHVIMFRAVGSDDSVSVGANGGLLRQFDREVRRQWNLMAGPRLPRGEWHTYEALFDERGVGHFLDGKVIHYQPHADWQVLPRLPHGPLELVVGVTNDAAVRLRNLQVKFLRPTPEQIHELSTNPGPSGERGG